MGLAPKESKCGQNPSHISLTRDTVSPGAKPGLEMAESSEERRRGKSGLREAPSRVREQEGMLYVADTHPGCIREREGMGTRELASHPTYVTKSRQFTDSPRALASWFSKSKARTRSCQSMPVIMYVGLGGTHTHTRVPRQETYVHTTRKREALGHQRPRAEQ